MPLTDSDRARPTRRHLAVRERSAAPVRPRAGSAGGSGYPWSRPWRPLAGAILLDRLRTSGRPRPRVDPELAAGLGALLESGIGSSVSLAGGRPLVVTRERLTAALCCVDHAPGCAPGEPSLALACGALIGALFKQLVTLGSLGDPMDDGLAALGLDDRSADLVAWIAALPEATRRELRSEVERQAADLVLRWPLLEASWLPRTRESMRYPLASGTVELVASVDLAIGRPAEREASVAFVEITSGSYRPTKRADLHYAALVETLRHTAPPFAVATYYTRTGELDVEPITVEALVAAARRVTAGAAVLLRRARGLAGEPPPELCPVCSASPWELVDRTAGAEWTDRVTEAC